MLIEWRFEHKAIRKSCAERGLIDPYVAYRAHHSSAKQRGIEFLIGFDDWWGIWETVYHLRGQGKNRLCMARTDDKGPYAADNVYITTNLGNLLDYHSGSKAKAATQLTKARNHANKKQALWCKKVAGIPHLVMERKVYYEEPID